MSPPPVKQSIPVSIRLLSLDGFEVEECRHFADAANEVLTAHPDCIILALKLPGTDGLSICRGIRAQSTVPIIILTSSDSEFDEVMGMNIGADDYIQKPYSPAILLARIRSVLRRANPQAQQVLEYRGVSLDLLSTIFAAPPMPCLG